jgi:hypothetical protein
MLICPDELKSPILSIRRKTDVMPFRPPVAWAELTRNNNTGEFPDMTVSGVGFAATSEHFRESRNASVVSWAAIRLDTNLSLF